MSRKKALKVHFVKQGWWYDTWSVRGNDTRMNKGMRPYRHYDSDVIEASNTWGAKWTRHYHPVSALFTDAERKGIPVEHKSGKKEKKFWRKVLRRIERFTDGKKV